MARGLEIAQRHGEAIRKLANVSLEFKPEAAPKAAAMRSTAEFDLVLHLPQAQEEAQRKRMEKQAEQLEKQVASLDRQLNDENFVAKAPPHVVEGMRQKLADYKTQLDKLRGSL